MENTEWFEGLSLDHDKRNGWRRVGFVIFLAFLLAMILGPLYGCADDRWLSKEEDAEMRAACEPVGGCAVIPNPVWKQIQRALGLDDA